MDILRRPARVSARLAACALAATAGPLAAFGQTAAQPAGAATELPTVEVQATPTKAKKSAQKKNVDAVATSNPAVEPTPRGDIRPTGVSNPSPVVDYVAGDSTSATKTDTPLKETPQSISVVGQEQMRDQGVQNLQEALRYIPGAFADPFGFDSRGDSSIIRGIAGSYFVDGLRTTYGYSQSTVPIEPYSLERVEVLRGPSSMLYGQAPTGGIVNAVSKLPSDIPYREIGVEYGSFDFKQVKLDMTGPLTQDGKWLYRIVGLARDADTQVDFVENDRLMLAPSLTYRPTNDTSITVLGHLRNDKSGSTQQFLPAEGTLFPNTVTGERVRRSTFTGEPTDRYDTESQSVSALVDHKFSDALKLRHVSRYVHTENDYDSTYAASLSPTRMQLIDSALGAFGLPPGTLVGDNAPFLNAGRTELARARTATYQETDIFNTDTNLTATFDTGWVVHKVTGGFDYMRFQTNQRNAGTIVDNMLTTSSVNPALQPFFPLPFQPAFDIYNPRYGQSNYLVSFTDGIVSPDALPFVWRPEETQSQTGIYIQDQIKVDRWVAVLGLRHDWLKAEQAGGPDEDHTATTGRAALMYNFDFGLTPYVSYSTSFTPLPGQPVGSDLYTSITQGPAALRPAGPIEGEQIEVGFKYQPNGVPFVLSAAAYELLDKNQIVQPDVLFDAVQGADVKVRGFEIEAIGRITPEIKMIGSYSYTDAVFDKYPELYSLPSGISDFMEGKRVDGIPQHLASLWAIYSVLDGPLRGLSFGAGVRYVGGAESWGRDITSGQELFLETPSFTLFDAMVAYETDDWRWQLTAQNLEDEYVITSCAVYRGDCFIGQARTITTGFTYKF
ncbi:MAG TPA: TonB-dependent siderophore receptor [Hyphomicrobium sp.]|nr:TonB-dependent siderophore receptor [Hyphomicrobium sp.]